MAEGPARPDSRRPVRVTAAPRRLSFLPLLAVVFFNVSGGPYGIEDAVSVFGPGLTLLLLALTPVLVALPIALAMAEMGGALPEEGGYVTWVRRVFGPFWSFQVGWWSWVNSFVDVAVYPALFADYLRFWRPEMTALERWLIALAFIWLLTAVNLAGIRVTGWGAVALAVGALAPILALIGVAVARAHAAPWAPFAAPGHGLWSGLGVGIAVMMWNYSGWDTPSTVLGETERAETAYRRALWWALPLIALSNIVPVAAALADRLLAGSSRSHWRAGPRARCSHRCGARLGRPLSLPGADELAPALRPGPRGPAPALAGPNAGAHGRAMDLRARLERRVQPLRRRLVQGADRAQRVAVLPHPPPRAGGVPRPPLSRARSRAAVACRRRNARAVDHRPVAIGRGGAGHGDGGLEEHGRRGGDGGDRPGSLVLANEEVSLAQRKASSATASSALLRGATGTMSRPSPRAFLQVRAR